jgi:DNA-binding transcriptional regulator YiaG
MAPLNLLTRPARTFGLGLTAFGLATSAGFVATPILEAHLIYDRSTGAWIQDAPADVTTISYSRVQTPGLAGGNMPAPSRLAPAESVRQLRAESGLTWDQLARLFGVSRRAVHHWASGGRMNSVNEEHLAAIWEAVRRLPTNDPTKRRSLLISTPETGLSVFELLKAGRPTSEVLQAAAYSPDLLIGGSES